MPFIYIYSPSDFIGSLPSEQNAAAAGSPTFTLTLSPTAQPTVIEISDNDLVFDEVDGSQSVATTVNFDGSTITAGTTINTAYDLINTSTGHQVTSFHFGGNGYQQGAVDGIASTVPLQPGQSYTFNVERTSHQQNNLYSDYAACFTKGTRIDVPGGSIRIENLRRGDWVKTLDDGLQQLLWVGTRRVAAEGAFAPVRFDVGAIGNQRAFEVSPEHRMLMYGGQVELYFGASGVLVPAKALVNGCDITRRVGGEVSYFHLLFEGHQIVFAEGVPSESLLLCDHAIRGFADHAAYAEAKHLFADLPVDMRAARICLKPREVALLAA